MLLEFLQRIIEQREPLRPPGAAPENVFDNKCIRCRKCLEACPYDSIKIAHAERGLKMGTPYIFPAQIPCYLCDDWPCIDVCPTGALDSVQDKESVRMGKAVIDSEYCFAYNDIVCRACFERCPIYREAIVMKDELYPQVAMEHCVGCGICEHVCPTEPKSIIVFTE